MDNKDKEEKNKKNKKEKEKKEDKKEDKKHKKEEYKDFFLYFIVASYGNPLEIKSLENKYCTNLEKLQEKDFYLKNDIKIFYILYRIKITPKKGMNSLTLKFKIIYSEENFFFSEIELKEFFQDIFYYDFDYYVENNIKKGKKHSDAIGPNLTHLDQLKIYLSYLKDDLNLAQNSPEMANLLLSTRKIMIIKEKEKDKKKDYLDLSLFFLAFCSFYENQEILNLLSDFNLDKINKEFSRNKIFSHNEIEDLSEIFDKLENNPDIILKNVTNDEDKIKIKENIFLIILCFRLFNEIYKFGNSLSNILLNEDIKKQIYKDLGKYDDIFEGIIFEKEQISQMVKALEKFSRIKRALSNLNDISDYLELIFLNLEHISLIRKKEKKPEDMLLVFDANKIRATDKIKSVCDYYGKILDVLKEKEIDYFVILSPLLIQNYIQKFHNNNLENLILLKNLIMKLLKNIKTSNKANKSKKERDKEKEMGNEADNIIKQLKESIHKTGLHLARYQQLNNAEILNFLKEDKDYMKQNKDEVENELEILQGLNLSEIDDKFLDEWKSLDLIELFGDNQNIIEESISNIISDFKNFKILGKLLKIGKNDASKGFSSNEIKLMQNKFINLLEEQEKKDINIFNEDLVELIYYSDSVSDENAKETKDFLNEIQNKLNFDLMKDIYYALFNKHEDNIKEETKKFIC